MKKLWILVTLLVAATIVLWQWQPWQIAFSQLQPPAQHSLARPIALPTADSERLFNDLNHLNFVRYSEPDRQRARDYIARELQVAGWTVEFQPFAGGVNLYAERLGSQPQLEPVLLGGHYDTVELSPGVDDNSTAVATLLEAARLLKQPTARTLQLVFFDSEERGLLGSTVFVQQIKKGSLVGAIVLDMIGYACQEAGCQSYPPLPVQPETDRGNFLAALGDQGHPNLLQSLTSPTHPNLPQVLTLSIPTFGGLTPDLVRSDHAPFWDKGIGAVLVTDTANFRNPHYHQPSDTLETIDPDFFVGSAQIVINAVTQLLQP